MNSNEQLKQTIASLEASQSQAARRFLAEMEFVEGLAGLEGKTKAWGKMIDPAWALVDKAAKGTFADIDRAVAQAERVLAPIGKAAKTYTIHCVGHAHIDMNWMWPWPETVHTTHDTFGTMLKLMDEFPDFTFTQSQASVYDIIRRYNPDMLRQIARRVKEGRWEIAASHWVEGDKNLASGESLARHLLYTREFMKEVFDLAPEDILIDWSPDTFGHAHTIPSIDARGGVRRYYLCRGGAYWTRPPVFWFQGPDGSRVLAYQESTWYISTLGPHNTKALLNFAGKTGLKEWMAVYGVGDHGGGPTRRDIALMKDMDRWPIFPNFRFGTTHKYFDILERHGDRWPVLDRELNFECDGCYTSQSLIKKSNRLGEIYAIEAEWAGVLGMRAVGMEYPAQTLREVWQDVLFTHFHDILPGSGVPATRYYNQGKFQQLAAATSMIKTRVLRALAGRVKTQLAPAASRPAMPQQESLALGAGIGRGTDLGGLSNASATADLPRPFVVFNQLAQKRREVVVATIWDPRGTEGAERNYVIRTADGRELPAQKIGQGGHWSQKYIDVAFPADVDSLGYNTYVVVDAGETFVRPQWAYNYEILDAGKGSGLPSEVRIPWLNPNWVTMPQGPEQFTMENDHLRVEFDLATGGIKSLVDKAAGLNLADAADPLGVLEYVIERQGTMTAWVTYPPSSRPGVRVLSVSKGATGPWVASVIVKAKAGDSEITLTYSLKAHAKWLDIELTTRWMEIGGPSVGVPKLLMKFPLAIRDAKATYEIPFGAIRREENSAQEVPALRWADVNGKSSAKAGEAGGCALLNDSKHGHSLDGSTLRLTLLRSSHDPDPLPEIGDHTIRMAVAPHGSAPSVAELMQMGAAFNQPLQVVATDLHEGDLPPMAAAVSLKAAGAILSSVKRAQDGSGVVFRLLETEGKAGLAQVALDGKLLGKAAGAFEVDLLERPLTASSAKVIKGGFTVRLDPHAIVSVKVVFDS